MFKNFIELIYKPNKPRYLPILQKAIKEGYQLGIEDIGFTDVYFQSPCNSGKHLYSRWNKEIDLTGYLTSNIQLKLPIISSSMPGVTNYEIAVKIGNVGGFAVLPRELSLIEIENMILKLKDYDLKNNRINRDPWYAGSVGVYPRVDLTADERVEKMVQLGIKVIFIETQQANSKLHMLFCSKLRKKYPKLQVVLGVFNSVDGVKRAIEAGANGVKVGIGTGDACLTSVMSGVTKGQVNTVVEIAEYFSAHKRERIPIIVDGGTSTPGGAAIMMTIIKGFGAIMLGSKIAAVKESPAKKIKNITNKGVFIEAVIEGMGSNVIAARRGEPKNQRILEGSVIKKPVKESIEELLLRYEGGFRTAMYGYHSAKNWLELANNAVIGLNSINNIISRLSSK